MHPNSIIAPFVILDGKAAICRVCSWASLTIERDKGKYSCFLLDFEWWNNSMGKGWLDRTPLDTCRCQRNRTLFSEMWNQWLALSAIPVQEKEKVCYFGLQKNSKMRPELCHSACQAMWEQICISCNRFNKCNGAWRCQEWLSYALWVIQYIWTSSLWRAAGNLWILAEEDLRYVKGPHVPDIQNVNAYVTAIHGCHQESDICTLASWAWRWSVWVAGSGFVFSPPPVALPQSPEQSAPVDAHMAHIQHG